MSTRGLKSSPCSVFLHKSGRYPAVTDPVDGVVLRLEHVIEAVFDQLLEGGDYRLLLALSNTAPRAVSKALPFCATPGGSSSTL